MVDVDARRQDVAQGFYVAATGCFVKPWDFPLLVVKASALGHTAVLILAVAADPPFCVRAQM